MRKETGYLLIGALTIIPVLSTFCLRPLSAAAHPASTPFLKRVAPDTITAGGRSFTILLVGSSFVPGAQVLFDGAPLGNPRVTSKGSQLLADVAAPQVASPGAHSIQAVNPDGGATGVLPLTVQERDPDILIRLTGNVAEEGVQSDLQIDMFGGTFDSSSSVTIWGFDSPMTTVVNETEITATIPQDSLATVAQIPVMVRNKGNRLSNYEIFFVVVRPPTVDFIDPDTIDVGAEDFTLDVGGSNFAADATVVINGQPLDTMPVKGGKLRATVPGALRSAAGELVVRVEQEGIQSEDQTLIVSPTAGPFIFSLSPTRFRQGGAADLMLVSGANFNGRTTAMIDGVQHDIRRFTDRELTIKIGRDLLAATESHTLQLMDADGNLSNIATFNVVPDVTVTTLSGVREGFNDQCVGAGLALYRGPRRLMLGPDGLLYVADQINNAIRSINRVTGEVCTIAGTGFPGYVDSINVRGWAPVFSTPNGLAVASDGTIFVSENGNAVIRRISRNADGTIAVDTFAGTAMPIPDMQRQDKLNSTEVGLSGFRDGLAPNSLFEQPDDIAISANGTMYVSDPANSAIRRIRQMSGQTVVDTLAGSGVPGFIDGVAQSARFNTPTGIALSRDGQFLLVADFGNQRIRRVNLTTGEVDTLAGNGRTGGTDGPAADATFNSPIGLAVDADGVIYVSEFNPNRIRRIEPSGDVSTVTGGRKAGLVDGPGKVARFRGPRGLAIDTLMHVLYVADFDNNVVRSIALTNAANPME